MNEEGAVEAIVGASLAGAVTFPITLALLQRSVFVPLRIRAHQRVIGTAAGLASVSLAGIASASTSSLVAHTYPIVQETWKQKLQEQQEQYRQHHQQGQQQGKQQGQHENGISGRYAHAEAVAATLWALAQRVRTSAAQVGYELPDKARGVVDTCQFWLEVASDDPVLLLDTVANSRATKYAAVVSVSTLVPFLLFGGRPRRVLPSCLWHRGAFAVEGLPAKSADYATSTQKTLLGNMGRMHGCHSCGTRRAPYYVGDHIPPNKLANGRPQQFFPQCPTCSSTQGASVGSGTRAAKTHGATLRLYHLWLPLPWLLAAALLGPAHDDDSQSGDGAGLLSSWDSSTFTNGFWKLFSQDEPAEPAEDTQSRGRRRTSGSTPTWAEMGETLVSLVETLGSLSVVYASAGVVMLRQWLSGLHEDLTSGSSYSLDSGLLSGLEKQQGKRAEEASYAPADESSDAAATTPPSTPTAPTATATTTATTAAATQTGFAWPSSAAGPATAAAQTAEAGAQAGARTQTVPGSAPWSFPTEEVVLSVQPTLLPASAGTLNQTTREALLATHKRLARRLQQQRQGEHKGAAQRGGGSRNVTREQELIEDDIAMLGVEMQLLQSEGK